MEVTGPRRRPFDQIRDADAQRGENVLFGGKQNSVGEACGVQELPKSVARSGKVEAKLARQCSGVDAAKEQSKVGPDQVRNASGISQALHLRKDP
jgi:hypothetical protein